MNRPSFSSTARNDLNEIVEYIAQHNVSAARRLVEQIEEACRTLARHPKLGTRRDELLADLRVFPVRKYVICYRPTGDGIDVIRVVHGARDFDRLFDFR